MKKLFLALALVAFIGTTSLSSFALTNEAVIALNEEGGKDKKDKKKKSCESKATEAKAEGKSCSKAEGEKKACCASKKAEAIKAASETKEEVK